MGPKRRDGRVASISAVFITTLSISLFYLIFYRLVNFGFLTRPLGFLSLLSYPGMLPGFVIAGGLTGNFHTGANNLVLVLFIAIPLNLALYFFATILLLRIWRLFRTNRKTERVENA